MTALADLLVPATPAVVQATQIQILQLAGFPATAWQSGSVPQSLLQADCQTVSDASVVVSKIAAGGLLELAALLDDPGWLTLLALSHYGLARKSAVATRGTLVLTDNGGGPHTIVENQLYAGPPAGELRFQNIAGGSLPLNGTLSLTFQAEGPGAAYNLANGAITRLLTTLPGVTVSNPATTSGTWITTQGADEESNTSLVTRCKARWPQLGAAANELGWLGWALEPVPAVTRAGVIENYPSGGHVSVFLGGSNGGSSPSDVTTVDAYLQARRPLCVTVHTAAAANFVIALTGTVFARSSQLAAAQAAFNSALTAFAREVPIGGMVQLVDILTLLRETAGVTNVDVSTFKLNGAVADVALTPVQIATFTTSGILWTPV